MEDIEDEVEDELFNIDEISGIVKYSVDTTLGASNYQNKKVGSWVNSIVESSLASLSKLQKSYKYIGKMKISSNLLTSVFIVVSVTCIIFEKSGAGLLVSSSCVWDKSTDGSCSVRWENKTMCCIVNVFGLSI